jgi:hypothetical protein
MLREGLEAVVFVGGVSLGQSADSIPIAAIVGIICGLLYGFVIYAFASRAGRCQRVLTQSSTDFLVPRSTNGFPRHNDQLHPDHRRRFVQQICRIL